ncbi:hypothetical protein D3C71_1924500 [compost metagenome]
MVHQLAAQAKTTKSLAHIEALHLAGVRVVDIVDWSQGAAAGHGAFHKRQYQMTAWRGIFAGQLGQFFLKALEIQVHIQAACVFHKNFARCFQLFWVCRMDERYLRSVHGRGT